MGLLLAMEADGLGKITLAIHEPHRHQRHTKIARRFQVISCQHTQPTGIQR